MADKLTIDVDTAGLLAALDALGESAEQFVRDAARETAQRIQRGGQQRARWGATGKTSEAITMDEAPGPLGGYRVYVGPTTDERGSRPANLPRWLEVGTRKMAAHPFLFAAARLEESAYLQRINRAIQAAIDHEGLR